MRPGAHDAVLSAARLYGPLMALFAFALLALRGAGSGVGLVAGFAFAAALALYLIVFGADAAKVAFPPWAARTLAAGGLIAAMCGAGAHGLAVAPQLMDGGLFALTASGLSLVMTALAGRAPALRDEEW